MGNYVWNTIPIQWCFTHNLICYMDDQISITYLLFYSSDFLFAVL